MHITYVHKNNNNQNKVEFQLVGIDFMNPFHHLAQSKTILNISHKQTIMNYFLDMRKVGTMDGYLAWCSGRIFEIR